MSLMFEITLLMHLQQRLFQVMFKITQNHPKQDIYKPLFVVGEPFRSLLWVGCSFGSPDWWTFASLLVTFFVDNHCECPTVWQNKYRIVYPIFVSGWWLETFFLFFHILGMSYSQLTFIFFRGVGKPPTRNCVSYICIDGMHTHTASLYARWQVVNIPQ